MLRQGDDPPEEVLFHGSLLLLSVVLAFVIIPSTDGTGVDASAAAAAERADHEQECDADKDVDELVVRHRIASLLY
jgi:hypothetical protein